MKTSTHSQPDLQRYIRPFEDMPARIYEKPSGEQLAWVRFLRPLVAPKAGRGSLLSRAMGVFLVAPFAHITFFSLDYQAYLYDVFHQSTAARFWHQFCMPFVNLMIMVALAQFTFGAHPAAHGVTPFAWNGALIYAAVLLVWYVGWAIYERYYLWGVVMIPLVLLLLVGANLYYHATFVVDPQLRTWYAPTPLVYNPWLWMAIFPLIQALSHAPEPKLPPRVTETPDWATVPEYINGVQGLSPSLGAKTIRALRVAAQAVYGTIDEFWASPRLFPIGILEQMWRHGYQRERFEKLEGLVNQAIESGNPALDYIGEGGGTFLALPEE